MLLNKIKLSGNELKDIIVHCACKLMRVRRTNEHILFQQHTLFHPAPDLDSKSLTLVDL